MLVESELVKRILLAALIGGLIGAELEMRGRSAGFRTNILIAVGCAIFTIGLGRWFYYGAAPRG